MGACFVCPLQSFTLPNARCGRCEDANVHICAWGFRTVLFLLPIRGEKGSIQDNFIVAGEVSEYGFFFTSESSTMQMESIKITCGGTSKRMVCRRPIYNKDMALAIRTHQM